MTHLVKVPVGGVDLFIQIMNPETNTVVYDIRDENGKLLERRHDVFRFEMIKNESFIIFGVICIKAEIANQIIDILATA